MRIIRLTLVPALLAAALLGTSAAKPEEAAANVDHFCGYVLSPGLGCSNYPNISHWDRVRTRYPGHESHNVTGCVSMFNDTIDELRSDRWYCDRTWSTPTWNPWGHNYGPTSVSQYFSQNMLKLGNPGNHTLVGWTSDNQTDG